MYNASIAVASPEPSEDDHLASHPEVAYMLPAGLQALLISDTGSSSSSSTSGAGGKAIESIYIDLPPLDTPNQTCTKEGFLHKIGGNVKSTCEGCTGSAVGRFS
jgi:hypothetical protein